MFNAFKKKKTLNYFCLFGADKSWSLSKGLIVSMIDRIKLYQFDLSHYFGWNQMDDRKKGTISQLSEFDIADLVYLCMFDSEDYEKSSIKFNLLKGTPNLMYIEMPLEIHFDFKDFIFNVKDFFSIDYGFVYRGVAGKGTEGYIFGQRNGVRYLGDVGRTSENNFKAWQKDKLKIRDGRLRDIYRINLLNDRQVKNLCSNGLTFLDMIRSDKRFGVIDEIFKGHYYWQLNEQDLSFVKQMLNDESFLM